jgi:hypothetical protein
MIEVRCPSSNVVANNERKDRDDDEDGDLAIYPGFVEFAFVGPEQPRF